MASESIRGQISHTASSQGQIRYHGFHLRITTILVFEQVANTVTISISISIASQQWIQAILNFPNIRHTVIIIVGISIITNLILVSIHRFFRVIRESILIIIDAIAITVWVSSIEVLQQSRVFS